MIMMTGRMKTNEQDSCKNFIELRIEVSRCWIRSEGVRS